MLCNALNQMGDPWEVQGLALIKSRMQMQELKVL